MVIIWEANWSSVYLCEAKQALNYTLWELIFTHKQAGLELDVANFVQQVIIAMQCIDFDLFLFLLVNCWHPMARVNQDGEFNLHLNELQNSAFNGV